MCGKYEQIKQMQPQTELVRRMGETEMSTRNVKKGRLKYMEM